MRGAAPWRRSGGSDADPAGAAGPGPHSLVRGLDDALSACANSTRVTLISDIGAAGNAGPAWFKAIITQAQAAFPTVDITAILDCGDQAGDALGALRCGIKHILVDLPEPVLGRLREIAAPSGAQVANRGPTG